MRGLLRRLSPEDSPDFGAIDLARQTFEPLVCHRSHVVGPCGEKLKLKGPKGHWSGRLEATQSPGTEAGLSKSC